MLEFTDANFTQEVLDNAGLTLVDFWNPGCYPCHMLMPILQKVADGTNDVKIGKINTFENPKITEAYNIYAVPTLVFFSSGKVMKKMLGFQNEQKINDAIEEVKAVIRNSLNN
jgi:thioredoxin 1